MTRRSLRDALGWVHDGEELLAGAVDRLADGDLGRASGLPDWTRRHLLAHVAGNAEALGRLTHWAATGEVTPMYRSPEDRAADIESTSRLPAAELRARVAATSARLWSAMAALTPDQWRAEVVTAQGRTVPAAEIPWLRAREVLIHAVDLGSGVDFADLPGGFLRALCDEASRRHSLSGPALVLQSTTCADRWQVAGAGEVHVVNGSTADIAAYLTGRGDRLRSGTGKPAPVLGPWL